ncbi:MAG: hypothetical protein ACYT04_97410, partial [Nostoc sp.]
MTQKAEFSRFVLAFVAGFITVLVFYQGLLALLHAINFAPRAPSTRSNHTTTSRYASTLELGKQQL